LAFAAFFSGFEAVPLLVTMIMAVAAFVIILLSSLGLRARTVSTGISVAAFVISLALLLGKVLGYLGPILGPQGNSVFAQDWISYLFGVAILIVSILVALSSEDFLANIPNASSFFALLIFTTIGSVLLVFSTDLLMIFVAWELMSIPSYVLTGFKKKDQESNEAAVKYFLISAFASAVLLYGISLIYVITGTTNIYQILSPASSSGSGITPIAVLALSFVIAGFGIKLSAVPFHMWIPDAYQGAPTVVSALLSAGTKGATFAPAARIFFVLFAGSAFQTDWSTAFAVLALLSMTVGNFAALTQRSVTRILAYSSIGHGGYILIGFAAGTAYGLTASFFHILNYATMQTCAFLAAALIIREVGKDDLLAFDGVGRRMRIAPIALTLSLLALGGFPPLNGFWSKVFLFYSAIGSPLNLGWLAIAGIINSFVSIAFYLRIVKHMYVDQPQSSSKLFESNGFRVALIIASLIIVGTGVYPGPVIQFASTTATSFFSQISSASHVLPAIP
jgi:proton-translocating NADH-quinone oxidoreductase chain N